MSAPSPTRKAAWFRTLAETSTTSPTIEWMRSVWVQQAGIAGLPLAEPDYTRLALELAVRGVQGWRDVLERQSRRIEDPDRKAQFEFVRPAVSAQPGERSTWFEALRNVENRRHERWVAEGLKYLHHPLRAEASRRFIRPSLDLLLEIHETSNLGFPNTWLYHTLYGQNSGPAARIVLDFLESLPPDYPSHLRDSTLRETDTLFRAATIMERATSDRGVRLHGARSRSNHGLKILRIVPDEGLTR